MHSSHLLTLSKRKISSNIRTHVLKKIIRNCSILSKPVTSLKSLNNHVMKNPFSTIKSPTPSQSPTQNLDEDDLYSQYLSFDYNNNDDLSSSHLFGEKDSIETTTLHSSTLSTANNDTIYHVSTGISTSPVAIAIIRISGPAALPLLCLLSRKPWDKIKNQKPRVATVHNLYSIDKEALLTQLKQSSTNNTSHNEIHNSSMLYEKLHKSKFNYNNSILNNIPHIQHPSLTISDVIDLKALTLYFAGPKSYTGEDLVELHVHGNPLIVRTLLSTLDNIAHVRLAEPGEFTRRAFENNKMDLIEVEGINDIIHSTTQKQHELAVRQAIGDISRVYDVWRKELVGCLAYCESVVDFGEDEADIAEREILTNVLPRVLHLYRLIYSHLNLNQSNEIIKNGLKLSIVGAPNAGKSSLLNTITNSNTAIVSSIPGTTRDIVTYDMDMGGWPIVLYDTAGLRDATDIIEFEGVRRAVKLTEQMDMKLVLIDATEVWKGVCEWVDTFEPQESLHSSNKYSYDNITHLLSNSDGADKQRLHSLLLTHIPSHSHQMVDEKAVVLTTKIDLLPENDIIQKTTLKQQHTADPLYHNTQMQRYKQAESDAVTEKATLVKQYEDILKKSHNSQTQTSLENTNYSDLAESSLLQLDTEDLVDKQQLLHSMTASPNSLLLESILRDLYVDANPITIMGISSKYGFNVNSVIELVSTHADNKYGLKLENTSTNDSTFIHSSLPSELSQINPVINARHRNQLNECLENINMFLQSMGLNPDGSTSSKLHSKYTHFEGKESKNYNKFSTDINNGIQLGGDLVLSTEYLRMACVSMGKISGDVQVEELLDVIFNDFCIGK